MDWDKLAQDQAKRKQKDREIKHDGWDGRVPGGGLQYETDVDARRLA